CWAKVGIENDPENVFDTPEPEDERSPDEKNINQLGHPMELKDAHVAYWLASRVLRGNYLWVYGRGWVKWDGKRWNTECSINHVRNVTREATLHMIEKEAASGAGGDRIGGLSNLLSSARIRAVSDLATGLMEIRAKD